MEEAHNCARPAQMRHDLVWRLAENTNRHIIILLIFLGITHPGNPPVDHRLKLESTQVTPPPFLVTVNGQLAPLLIGPVLLRAFHFDPKAFGGHITRPTFLMIHGAVIPNI